MNSVSPSDGPGALVMGSGFMTFGLTMILRPAVLGQTLIVLLTTGSKGVGIHTRCHSEDCAWLEWP